ncbi:N-acetylmuramoyl-L-alanine amidase [Aquabacter sp. P-9]|uniref:N-acetylmuramoyl-L-alanine amidase n=1 Tax=Aquabacter sediminis TaxID=3029197 RepID=UPI00237DCD64|nr:N-acetylmuramoyl-L-alanine amidase [Aquabacter sp. P-9]MDE1569503.1 N-acetylmuramoyl-L-alanine amidase [Aquabacter sp. P-9]
MALLALAALLAMGAVGSTGMVRAGERASAAGVAGEGAPNPAPMVAAAAPAASSPSAIPLSVPVAAATDPATEPPPVSALDARLAGDGQRTRLILDLSKPAEFRAFTLANPYRVILDLTDVTFTLAETRVQTRRGLVSSFRYGVLAPGKARMVLDVTEPVMIDKAFVLPPAEGQPARLVLDLVRTDAATFNTTVATAAEARGAPSAALAPGPVADGDVRPVIVLDPGHGGIDSGTSGASSFNEKNIVLDVALALRTELERAGRYRVVMTRSTDVFVPLGERVQIARANRAALFISIHADALARDDGNARGASVYTLSETASDADAAHLAEKENKADLIAGVDLSEESDEVAGILFDLAQRETRNFSATFARTMVVAMKSVGRVHKTPVKSAGFKVLKAHDVPSVLVELGYMSSREDLKLLTSDAWREKLAQAMAGAIDDFFAPRFASGVGATGTITARTPAGK